MAVLVLLAWGVLALLSIPRQLALLRARLASHARACAILLNAWPIAYTRFATVTLDAAFADAGRAIVRHVARWFASYVHFATITLDAEFVAAARAIARRAARRFDAYAQCSATTLDAGLITLSQAIGRYSHALWRYLLRTLRAWGRSLGQSLLAALTALRAKGLTACIAALYARPFALYAPYPRMAGRQQLAVCAFIAVVALCRASLIFPLDEYYIVGSYARLPVNHQIQSHFSAPAHSLAEAVWHPHAGASDTPLFRGAISTKSLPAHDRLNLAFWSYMVDNGPAQGPLRLRNGTVQLETVNGPVLIAEAGKPDNTMPSIDDLTYTPQPWQSADADNTTVMLAEFKQCLRNDAGVLDSMALFLRGLSIPVPGSYSRASSKEYWQYARTYAEKYGLTVSLMMAIMSTESGFNPFAVSPRQAVGLMQIVPSTAGAEANRLMGGMGAPSVRSLLDPENNIRYGAAYLHLLDRYHFGGVANRASRQICVIAAYNGGPNAVWQMFHPERSQALEVINSISPSELYSRLVTEMPYAETRRYVERVVHKMRNYTN